MDSGKSYYILRDDKRSDDSGSAMHWNAETRSSIEPRSDSYNIRNTFNSRNESYLNDYHPYRRISPKNNESNNRWNQQENSRYFSNSSNKNQSTANNDQYNLDNIEQITLNSPYFEFDKCLICSEIFHKNNIIWFCKHCYQESHLNCMQEWAASPLRDRKCPGCPKLPFNYIDDTNNLKLDDNSEKNLYCNRINKCGHECKDLRHLRRCRPCGVMVLKVCKCGRIKYKCKCYFPLKCTKKCRKAKDQGKTYDGYPSDNGNDDDLDDDNLDLNVDDNNQPIIYSTNEIKEPILDSKDQINQAVLDYANQMKGGINVINNKSKQQESSKKLRIKSTRGPVINISSFPGRDQPWWNNELQELMDKVVQAREQYMNNGQTKKDLRAYREIRNKYRVKKFRAKKKFEKKNGFNTNEAQGDDDYDPFLNEDI